MLLSGTISPFPSLSLSNNASATLPKLVLSFPNADTPVAACAKLNIPGTYVAMAKAVGDAEGESLFRASRD
jgi:hypothetical protein